MVKKLTMVHGLNSVLKKDVAGVTYRNETGKSVGSRRIFAPHFKLQVLDSYRNDADCKGNQRATARKYGIHRRQIQKWLQAENALRNSVSNAKEKLIADKNLCDNRKSCNAFEMTLNSNRQRDDESASRFVGIESRVPALTQSPLAASYSSPPLPLDYTMHKRIYSSSPIVARSNSPRASRYHSSPIDLSLKRNNSVMPDNAPVCFSSLSPQILSSTEYQPDVWDLSTKKNHESSKIILTNVQVDNTPEKTKTIKLFKPYLDDLNETTTKQLSSCAVFPSRECCINSSNSEIKTEHMNQFISQELQPNLVNYFYSHEPEYEVGFYCYEDIGYGQNLIPVKQRQSYSSDFKLRTIDCYYQDTICRGSQRAVATKYNIHRRQVQKWLKQADELKLQNESMNHLHAVR